MPTLKELSVLYAKKQPGQVDQLLEDAPILARMPFQEATHDLWNVYEEVTDVTGAGFVNFDAVLPSVSAGTEARQTDLAVMGGQIEVGEDKAQVFGGRDAYFAKQMPFILKKTGMSTEYALLYNNLRKYCIDNSLLVSALATGGKNYSILAVRFDSLENTGLYSPKGFSNGALLTGLPINGGNLYKNASGVLVYGMRLKAYFGWQIASKRAVKAIVNVTSAKLPTANQINDVLTDIRAGGNTVLLMHPRVKGYLGTKYKTDIVQMQQSENGINNMIDTWNGIPMLTSFNFLDGTEADVTVS